MSIGSIIKEKRLEAGLSLRKFSRECGVSPTYISHVEKGKTLPPPQGLLYKMAEILDLDGDDLVIGKGEVPKWIQEMILDDWPKFKLFFFKSRDRT